MKVVFLRNYNFALIQLDLEKYHLVNYPYNPTIVGAPSAACSNIKKEEITVAAILYCKKKLNFRQ